MNNINYIKECAERVQFKKSLNNFDISILVKKKRTEKSQASHKSILKIASTWFGKLF